MYATERLFSSFFPPVSLKATSWNYSGDVLVSIHPPRVQVHSYRTAAAFRVTWPLFIDDARPIACLFDGRYKFSHSPSFVSQSEPKCCP